MLCLLWRGVLLRLIYPFGLVTQKMDFLQGKTIVHKGNELVSADVALKKKSLILYYFTSLYCDACRAFDAKLKEVFYESSYRRVELAVIVVSCDDDKEDYTNNIRTHYHDWFAIKYEDELSHILTYNYGITHIPSLVVVRKNGAVVTRDGKKDVDNIGINVLMTWSD